MRPLPPPNFCPAGKVLSAAIFAEPPPFIQAQRLKKVRGRKAEGKRYEAKAHKHFTEIAQRANRKYIAGPWIRFEAAGQGIRWCQPDALILPNGQSNLCTIIEYKYQHVFDAWYQLFELYKPVVQFLFPTLQIGCCEVVKWFDPATFCDPQARLAEDPMNLANSGSFHVHIWRP